MKVRQLREILVIAPDDAEVVMCTIKELDENHIAVEDKHVDKIYLDSETNTLRMFTIKNAMAYEELLLNENYSEVKR